MAVMRSLQQISYQWPPLKPTVAVPAAPSGSCGESKQTYWLLNLLVWSGRNFGRTRREKRPNQSRRYTSILYYWLLNLLVWSRRDYGRTRREKRLNQSRRDTSILWNIDFQICRMLSTCHVAVNSIIMTISFCYHWAKYCILYILINKIINKYNIDSEIFI